MASRVEYCTSLLIYDRIAEMFRKENVPASLSFGWDAAQLEPAEPKEIRGRVGRVVFIPGDAEDSLGTAGPPRFSGGNPRSVGLVDERFTVVIWAFDNRKNKYDDQRAQYEAVYDLFAVVYRMLMTNGYGNPEVLSSHWSNECAVGLMLVLVVTWPVDLLDKKLPVADVDWVTDVEFVKRIEVPKHRSIRNAKSNSRRVLGRARRRA